MRRTERLAAPRVWLPRGGGRGRLRAAGVVALVVTAALLLLLHHADARQPANPAGPAPSPRPAVPVEAAPGECRSSPPHGTVGYPLRLPDPAVLAVVRAGQHVDVLVGIADGTADVIASDVTVLCGIGKADQPAGVLYLAVSPAQATALAAVGADARLSVTVRAPG